MMSLNITVFWDVTSCSLVDIDQHDHHNDGDSVLSSSELSASIYQTAWCRVPEDDHLYSDLMVFEMIY